jgi:site-specific recombinase
MTAMDRAMSGTVEPDWDAVRAEYEQSDTPIVQIAAAHGLTLNQLNTRRRKERWVLRNPGTGRQRRQSLLARMLGLIEAQITQLERKLSEEPMSATEMRMLESMTKALDKITALEAAEKKVVKKRVRMDPELEAIRVRLIDRISKLETED